MEAQVNFSEILDRVGPLREEVQELEDKALSTEAYARTIQGNVKSLEESIGRYKAEYANLIRETEAIKGEMDRVHLKVDRSERLLESLSSERTRWEGGKHVIRDSDRHHHRRRSSCSCVPGVRGILRPAIPKK